ncbi:MAG: glycosyltransferase family 2 protein [Anaerolineae bacterium]|nr:glycosyltransferase family 2 protein [Anaerolineae bacterium]
MLTYFFNYYDQWVDRYIFFDNDSTDQTLAMLEKHPQVEIRPFAKLLDTDSYVLAAQQIHDNCWKESRGLADWVIITAVDEFLYVPNLKAYLAECVKKGVTAIPALGFQMISPTLPVSDQNLPKQITRGCPWIKMNKLSLFNPNKIIETNYSLGRHSANPVGQVIYPTQDRLLLLHYKYLSFEHTFNRHAQLQQKLGAIDKENGWGHRYGWTKEKFKSDWDHFQQNSIENIFSRHYNPHLVHSPLAERWWRNHV